MKAVPMTRTAQLVIAATSALLFSAGAPLFATGAQAETVSPTDSDLQYVGRWDTSNASRPWAYAQGSTLIATFTGTSISATLNVTGGEYFRVIIDGDDAASTRISFTSGVPLSLASSLAAGSHKFELVKETNEGRATFLGLDIDTGASTIASPSRPTRRIVFYGDSNLAGYSLSSERNQGGSNFIGTHYGYAGITARMFDAEYQNISLSGATITSLNTAYRRIDWSTASPTWDFPSCPVDVVVVNIGANDWWRSAAQNKTRYKNLLDDLRLDHPLAHIVLYNAYGWDFTEPANYTDEVIAEYGDANTSWAVFPWVFEQYHGCQTDHAGMAQYLAVHLSTITGWSADAPDVVSGYGQDGDLANGSFEESAPFGGWGWRYFDDPGVSRPLDPPGAHHGDYYLRLLNGASSQQTNPANDGDEIELSMWLRGASDGDEVAVAISFRNQDQGADFGAASIQKTVETKVLTTEWQRYTMTEFAPSGGPDPVYSYRVTFTSAPGDTVDIDMVAVGEEPVAAVPIGASWALVAVLAGVGLKSLLRRRG
jgi:hypothetical protein